MRYRDLIWVVVLLVACALPGTMRTQQQDLSIIIIDRSTDLDPANPLLDLPERTVGWQDARSLSFDRIDVGKVQFLSIPRKVDGESMRHSEALAWAKESGKILADGQIALELVGQKRIPKEWDQYSRMIFGGTVLMGHRNQIMASLHRGGSGEPWVIGNSVSNAPVPDGAVFVVLGP